MKINTFIVPIKATLHFVDNVPVVTIETGKATFVCQPTSQYTFEVLDNNLDEYVIHTANETALTFEVKAAREPLPEDVVDAFF